MSKSNYLLFATKNGLVKKTEIAEYESIRASGLIALKMDDGDSLLGVKQTSGEDEVILVTANGKSIRFSEKDIRPTGRATRGVRGIRIGKPADSAGRDDEVIGMDVISGQQAAVSRQRSAGSGQQEKAEKLSSYQADLLIVTENGFGKKTPIEQYSRQGRGGKGVFTAKVTKKTGKVVDMRLVSASSGQQAAVSKQQTANSKQQEKAEKLTGCLPRGEALRGQADLLIISSQGQVIRLPLASVPTLGRQTQGVHLINLTEGDTVAALALLENE